MSAVKVWFKGILYKSLEERKRQYEALRRAIYRDAPPELIAKYSMSTDMERSLDQIRHVGCS